MEIRDFIDSIKNDETLRKEFYNVLKPYFDTDMDTLILDSVNDLNKKLSELMKLFDKAVSKIEEHIEALEARMDKTDEHIARIEEHIARIENHMDKTWEILKDLKRSDTQLRSIMGSFTNRSGKWIENTILGVYKTALKNHNITISKIRKAYITDTEGVILKGKRFEADMVEDNNFINLFEIKNFADEGAIEQLSIRKKILESKYRDGKKIRLFIVSNFITDKYLEVAKEEGITVISGNIVKEDYTEM